MPTHTAPDLVAATVLRAATGLGGSTGDGGVASVSAELDTLAAALTLVAKGCDDAATRIVPRGAGDESIGGRYDRAASDWPVVPPPSRERLAALLTTLHDAGITARHAAALCEHAKRQLDAALHRARGGPL
jgi:hypothetical protein